MAGKLTRRMHDDAYDKTTGRTAGKVQRRPLLHAQMLDQPAFGKEVCRKLYGASEACPDHGRSNTTIKAAYALALVDLT